MKWSSLKVKESKHPPTKDFTGIESFWDQTSFLYLVYDILCLHTGTGCG
jgi:hypothetical protein